MSQLALLDELLSAFNDSHETSCKPLITCGVINFGYDNHGFCQILLERLNQRKNSYPPSLCMNAYESKHYYNIFSKHYNYTLIDIPNGRNNINTIINGIRLSDIMICIVPDTSVCNFPASDIQQILSICNSFSFSSSHLIIAIEMGNKQQIYTQKEYNSVLSKVNKILKSVGYHENKIIKLPINIEHKDNIFELSKRMRWYEYRSLADIMDYVIKPPIRYNDKPLQLSVAHYCKAKDVFIAKIIQGTITINDTLKVYPSQETAVVDSIFVRNNKVDKACCGDIIGVKLTHCDDVKCIQKGDTLMIHNENDPSISTQRFIQKFSAIVLINDEIKSSQGVSGSFYGINGAVSRCDMSSIKWKMNKSTDNEIVLNPQCLNPGDTAEIIFELDRQIYIPSCKNNEDFARFVVIGTCHSKRVIIGGKISNTMVSFLDKDMIFGQRRLIDWRQFRNSAMPIYCCNGQEYEYWQKQDKVHVNFNIYFKLKDEYVVKYRRYGTSWQSDDNCLHIWITNKQRIFGHGLLTDGGSRYYTSAQEIKGLEGLNVTDFAGTETHGFAICGSNEYIAIVFCQQLGRKFKLGIPQDIINLIHIFYYINEVYSGYYDDFPNVEWKAFEAFRDKHIVEMATGDEHAMFLDLDGVLWGFGSNRYGELGRGLPDEDKHMIPTKMMYFSERNIKIIAIECGYSHNLALDSNGNVYSWGYNGTFQCGLDNRTDYVVTPTLILIDAMKIQCIAETSYVNVKHGDINKHYVFGEDYCQDGYETIQQFCINEMVHGKTDLKVHSVLIQKRKINVFVE